MAEGEDGDRAVATARALQASAQALSRRLLDSRGPQGLSVAKMNALGQLHREGPLTATALATYLRIQPQSLTRLLAALEGQKLITRREDTEDRRQERIAITERGTKLLSRDVRERRALLARVIARELTPAEQSMLAVATELMDRLAQALATSAKAAAAPQSEDQE